MFPSFDFVSNINSCLQVWLFDEHERTPSVKPSTRKNWESRERELDREEESVSQPTRPRGLRDIYDRAAANSAGAPPPVSRPTLRGGDGEVKSPTKATDRLKALRDAKRGAMGSSSVIEREEEASLPPVDTRQKRRVGLPAGPRPF